MPTRRDILIRAWAGALVASCPGLTLARAATERRFVLVILRGAADGLAIAPPVADPDYEKVRGELALPAPGEDNGALGLDGFFGLHPALTTIHEEYRRGQALVVHAVASPYRDRSHFDGQDILENGGATIGRLRDGWLNRALAPLGGSLGEEIAIAMAQNTPLVLRGDNSVTSWAPSRLPDADESTLQRLGDLYADDEFFASRLAQALRSQHIADADGMSRRGDEVTDAAEAAAKFLTARNGPRVAVIEASGWDTHANQGAATGQLANRLAGLDTGIATLRKGLGESWDDTVVAIVTEFGRTVHINGTRGTDHGTAGAALLVGGAVRGGRVIADWPGLAPKNLHEGRDLRPVADLRSLFKAVLGEHLGLDATFIDQTVFPDSGVARRLEDLVRA